MALGCCLVLAVTSLAGAAAPGRLTGAAGGLPGAAGGLTAPGAAGGLTAPGAAGGLTGPSLRVLQLNLCDSGLAGCYTGRAVRAAAEVVRGERPDVVTLNEVCRDDVSALERAMTGAHPGGVVKSAFTAAGNRDTDGPVRCRNGQPYGIGVLARVRSSGYRAFAGVYPVQDADDVEDRVWLCLHAAEEFYACTTHLASTSTAVALGQCGYLLDTAIPGMRARNGPEPVVLGGDLNLGSEARSCLPPGHRHVDDGARQHLVATADYAVTSRTTISMQGATDHPALLADLTAR